MTEIQKVSYYKWKNLFSGENYGIRKKAKVIDGNAFYEIDLKCLEEKKKKQEAAKKHRQKGQRK